MPGETSAHAGGVGVVGLESIRGRSVQSSSDARTSQELRNVTVHKQTGTLACMFVLRVASLSSSVLT